jgi:hypothetical protein
MFEYLHLLIEQSIIPQLIYFVNYNLSEETVGYIEFCADGRVVLLLIFVIAIGDFHVISVHCHSDGYFVLFLCIMYCAATASHHQFGLQRSQE